MVRSFALAALFAAALPLAASAAARPLELRDLRAAVTLVNPQIAPDGKQIALVVRRADYAANKYRNTLVLVDARTGAQTVVTRGREDAGDAAWSPHGDRLAFTATPAAEPDAKATPAPQLYVWHPGGGEPAKITDAPRGVRTFAWRPDGGAFAFTTEDEAPDKKRIDAHDDGFEITDAAWTEHAAKVPRHVWTIAASGGRAKRLTSGPWTAGGGLAFAPDGKNVYVDRTSRPTNHYRDGSIARIDVASRRVTALLGPGLRAGGPLAAPAGNRIAFVIEHPGTPSQSDIAVAGLDGSHVRVVTQRLDRNVQFVTFASDGNALYSGANDGVRDRLYRITLDGAVTVLPLGDANLAGPASISRDGTLAFVTSAPQRPAELSVLGPRDRAPRILTHYNAPIAARALPRTREVGWTASDGFAADGALTEPAGYVRGRRYPLVMLIHGGPTATSTTSYSSLVALMSARGWFVFQPNYRGSDNAGHRWAQATVPHITSAPARDCEEGLAAVLRTGEIDTARIGVTGWSEGGLMTSWLIGHDTRWKSAMSGAAVNDWVGYADLTDSKDFTPSFIGPSPWTSDAMMQLYEDESPLTYASAVKTRTLIMTDAGDQRVPTPLDYEFYHAIRATGTPVEMLVLPRNGHNPADPMGQEVRTREWVGWFARTL